MGLFAKNGKLLVDGARLRGCCCKPGWRLTAFSYSFEGGPLNLCKAEIIEAPTPGEAVCSLNEPSVQVGFNIEGEGYGWHTRVRVTDSTEGMPEPGCGNTSPDLPAWIDAAVHNVRQTIDGDTATVVSEINPIYEREYNSRDAPSYDVIMRFTYYFVRCWK